MKEISIVYQNSDFIIINKPSKISFHDNNEDLGLFNQVKQQFQINLWPVHRLDQLTSGLLILAKNQSAASQFGELFEKNEIGKIYIALSNKKPKKKQGKIIGDMKKSRNGNWKLTQSSDNAAYTHFYSRSLLAGQRFFWITPKTGKTHQIRVALKSVGSPILGDVRYGGSPSDRGYLHAYGLNFLWNNVPIKCRCLPTTGELFVIPELRDCINFFEEIE